MNVCLEGLNLKNMYIKTIEIQTSKVDTSLYWVARSPVLRLFSNKTTNEKKKTNKRK